MQNQATCSAKRACGLTEYVYRSGDGGKAGLLALESFNQTFPVEADGTPVTTAPDANVAPR